MKNLKTFLSDMKALSALPSRKQYAELALPEYPFDLQLLTFSPLYRKSRSEYLKLGGRFQPRVCSTMRSLSSQDLVMAEIDYSPVFSEMLWFQSHGRNLPDWKEELQALNRFHDISLFHEQNHRIIWKLLPPPPADAGSARRYLNFAESLVVALDVALGEEAGKISESLERLMLYYRPWSKNKSVRKKTEQRKFLMSVLCGTYLLLERIQPRDILKAINYFFPGQNDLNRVAVKCSLELNPYFTEITNPEWQRLFGRAAIDNLRKLHAKSRVAPLLLPADPLDLENELDLAEAILIYFGL